MRSQWQQPGLDRHLSLCLFFNRGTQESSFAKPASATQNIKTPGNYNAQVTISANYYSASASAVASVPITVVANNASCGGIAAPDTVIAGNTFSADITMNNTGTKPWTTDSSPHRLGAQDPQDNVNWAISNRIGLPSEPINSGQSATFAGTFTATTTPGTYNFDWQMLEEGLGWFGAKCTKTITVVQQFPLSVSKTGTGSGTITSNPSGISCGSTCTTSFISGTSVTLTASPDTSSTFAGWSGEGCSGTGSCVVSVTQARNVTATFNLPPTLFVALSTAPSSGNAPLNNVILTADPSGTASGTINYTFYCNRSDSGTNVISGYAHKLDATSTDPYSALAGVCNSVYSSAGTYTAKVIVEKGGLAAQATTTITVNVPPPPNAPSGLSAAAASCSQINLSWTDNSSDETGFRIERCSGSGCSSFSEITTVGASVTLYSNTSLSASTNYSYRVRAYNVNGNSGYSNTASAATPACPVAPTVTLGAVPITVAYNASSTLSWSSTNATACTASGDWSGSKATSGGSESTGNLTSAKTYTLTCTGPGGSGSASVTVGAKINPWWKEIIPW